MTDPHDEAAPTLKVGLRPDDEHLLSSLSHELRAPLNAILAAGSALAGRRLSQANRENEVAIIEYNAKVVAKLVDDARDASQIAAGALTVRRLDTAIDTLMESARDSVRVAADAKQLRIALGLDPFAGFVYGDPDRLEQIVLNLLSNAVKFTPAGGKIDVRLDRHGDDSLRIIVKDNGKGFRPDVASSLFERKRATTDAAQEPQVGLGLGLPIAKHLVELHGGTLTAESEGEGTGATFTVLLPRSHGPAHDDAVARISRTTSWHPVLEGIKVLLVDDERDTRELLTAVLEQEGAEVASAPGTEEALEIIRGWRPDVLVSDIGMPNGDGYELIHAVRHLGQERGSDIPAGALTAYSTPRDSRLALKAGFQLHVPKPVTPSELVSMVARLGTLRVPSSTPPLAATGR